LAIRHSQFKSPNSLLPLAVPVTPPACPSAFPVSACSTLSCSLTGHRNLHHSSSPPPLSISPPLIFIFTIPTIILNINTSSSACRGHGDD
ncbi:Bgt-20117, partial [Blumeria graminis f. sp. tritici]